MSAKKKIPSLQALAFDKLNKQELTHIAEWNVYRRGFAKKIERKYIQARANPSYNATAQSKVRKNERRREQRTNSSYGPTHLGTKVADDFNKRMNNTIFKKHMCIDNGIQLTKKAMIRCFSSVLNEKLSCEDLENLFQTLIETERISMTKDTLVKICRVLPRDLLARATVSNVCRKAHEDLPRFAPVISLVRKSCGHEKLAPPFCLSVMSALTLAQLQHIVREYRMCDKASQKYFTIGQEAKVSFSLTKVESVALKIKKRYMLQCFRSATKQTILTCNDMCDLLGVLESKSKYHSFETVAPICQALSMDILVGNAVEEILHQSPEEEHDSFYTLVEFFGMDQYGEVGITKQTYLNVLGALPTEDVKALFESSLENQFNEYEDLYSLEIDK